MKQTGLPKTFRAMVGVLVLAVASLLIQTACRAADPKDSEKASAQLQQKAGDLLCGFSKAVAYSGFRSGQHPDRGDGLRDETRTRQDRESAIQKVLGGDMYLNKKMAGSVINRLLRGQTEEPKSPIEMLSDRELEVFRLLGQGKGVRQIGEELGVTIPTVNSFRNRIKEKLQLKSSTEVMLHAIHWVREESAG